MVTGGLGREAMKTWAVLSVASPPRSRVARSAPRASEGITASDQLHGDEFLREVLLDGQPLLDHAVLEQHLLHGAEGLDADAAVVRKQRARDLVGPQDRLRGP